MSWTQPMCEQCWRSRIGPPENASRLIDAEEEKCCVCGNSTRSGLYARVNPATVPYPS